MKLGEKLQRLRKKSGLSQEQLAAQITVSRQAVSKWELDEAMPDTDNIIQLARLFGVSCDYLLREEVDEPGAVPASAEDRHSPLANDQSGGLQSPGETHLDDTGWVRNAIVLSLGACAIGLLLALYGWFESVSGLPIIFGLIIQALGLILFELAAPRMGAQRVPARFRFYRIACWLISPALIVELFWLGFWHFGFIWMDLASVLLCSLILGGFARAILSILRPRDP